MHRPHTWTPALCGVLLGVMVGVPAVRAEEEQPASKTPQRGVLSGYPKGKYEANKQTTRQELAIVTARLARAIRSDANEDPQAAPPAKAVGQPNKPATRLELAVHLGRLLRAIESNPKAAEQAKPPKDRVAPASLPARVPKWARGDVAYLVARGYPVALPDLYKDLTRPALQKDVAAGITWALSSLASRGHIPPGDLAPAPPEPEPKP